MLRANLAAVADRARESLHTMMLLGPAYILTPLSLGGDLRMLE